MESVAVAVAVGSAVAADCVTPVVDVVEEGAAPDDAHPASARPVARMSAAAAGKTRR